MCLCSFLSTYWMLVYTVLLCTGWLVSEARAHCMGRQCKVVSFLARFPVVGPVCTAYSFLHYIIGVQRSHKFCALLSFFQVSMLYRSGSLTVLSWSFWSHCVPSPWVRYSSILVNGVCFCATTAWLSVFLDFVRRKRTHGLRQACSGLPSCEPFFQSSPKQMH